LKDNINKTSEQIITRREFQDEKAVAGRTMIATITKIGTTIMKFQNEINPFRRLSLALTAATEARKFVQIETANRLSYFFLSIGRIGRSLSSGVDSGFRNPRPAISLDSIANIRRTPSNILAPIVFGTPRCQFFSLKSIKCTDGPILTVCIRTGKVVYVFPVRIQDLRRSLLASIREVLGFNSTIVGV
jgi:hypothetical protein